MTFNSILCMLRKSEVSFLLLALCAVNVLVHVSCLLCSRDQLKCDGTVQKPDFVFQRNERVHLNRRGRQFGRLLAAEVCVSVVVMLDTPCSAVV